MSVTTSAIPHNKSALDSLDQSGLDGLTEMKDEKVLEDGDKDTIEKTQNDVEEMFADEKGQENHLRVVETSPEARYSRFNDLIGQGAFKKVYRGWDGSNGVEVAWNTVECRSLETQSGRRVLQEMKLLQQLDHPNIITFHASWLNRDTKELIFITELISSGSLRSFINNRPVRLCILKKWCREVLKALVYLHGHDPPIMHRDLKCENIFINGSTGEIRLGDLGLASGDKREEARTASLLGTPEFMAPEMYEEEYDEQVDIYGFGMCVLEIVTNDTPYSECDSLFQIVKKVTSYIPPESLNRVKRPSELYDFIYQLIKRVEPGQRRPSAKELMNCSFLSAELNAADSVLISELVLPRSETLPAPDALTILCSESQKELDSTRLPVGTTLPSRRRDASPPKILTPNPDTTKESIKRRSSLGQTRPRISPQLSAPVKKTTAVPPKPDSISSSSSQSLRWNCSACRDPDNKSVLNISLKILSKEKVDTSLQIRFRFDMNRDEVDATVQEMIDEGALPADLPADDVTVLKLQLKSLKEKFQARDDIMELRGRSTSASSVASSISSVSSVPHQPSGNSSSEKSCASRPGSPGINPAVAGPSAKDTVPKVTRKPMVRSSSACLSPELDQRAAAKLAQEDEVRRLESKILFNLKPAGKSNTNNLPLGYLKGKSNFPKAQSVSTVNSTTM